MLYVLTYLITLPLLVVGLISVFVFVRNVFKDLQGEKVLDPEILQSFRLPKKPGSKQNNHQVVPSNGERSDKVEENQGPDLSKLLERVSAIRAEDGAEAERFALSYFAQFGTNKIDFPRACVICGNETRPQLLKWKAVHKIPALRGAKTPEKIDTNSLWTVVGRCSTCDEKFILATRNAEKIAGELEWVSLQPDNFERLLAFAGKQIAKQKLGFVFRTLPDRSLIASGVAGEWIWLKSEYRSYV